MKRACQRQIVSLPVCRWIAHPSNSSGAQQQNPRPATHWAVSRADHGLQPLLSPGPNRASMPFLVQPERHTQEPAGIIRQRLYVRLSFLLHY
jgi:hypothetical protein